ncbi:MAG: hypothetical protein M3400_06120 [Actinomycetota bacterium]|nr:hypothetical protein [Actinomycetota bacterium]
MHPWPAASFLLVLDGRADDAILDSYGPERAEHVRHFIEASPPAFSSHHGHCPASARASTATTPAVACCPCRPRSTAACTGGLFDDLVGRTEVPPELPGLPESPVQPGDRHVLHTGGRYPARLLLPTTPAGPPPRRP